MYDEERNIRAIIENIYTIFRRDSIEDTTRHPRPYSFLSMSLCAYKTILLCGHKIDVSEASRSCLSKGRSIVIRKQ